MHSSEQPRGWDLACADMANSTSDLPDLICLWATLPFPEMPCLSTLPPHSSTHYVGLPGQEKNLPLISSQFLTKVLYEVCKGWELAQETCAGSWGEVLQLRYSSFSL